MARRRNTRRRNPIRSTGMLVINPRRKNTRRKNTRRKNTRRKNTLKIRANARRRNTRRRNASYKKIAGSWSGARRRNPRRRKTRRKNTRRRNSVLALRRKNTRRRNTRRKNTRRKNTRRRNGQSFLAKIPLIGKPLAAAAGFFLPAGLGAIAVEPTLLIAKFIGPMMPNLPASVFYVGTGLLMAGIISTAKFLPISAKLRKDLALAVASATGGVAYYKWRTGSDVTCGQEAAALEVEGVQGWADGLAYSVQPFSGYGAFIHGR